MHHIMALLAVERHQGHLLLLEVVSNHKDNIQIHHLLWISMQMARDIHQVKDIIRIRLMEALTNYMTHIMIHLGVLNGDHSLLNQRCQISMLCLQSLVITEEERLLMSIYNHHQLRCNLVSDSKLNPSNHNLISGIERNLKQLFLKWQMKHLLCRLLCRTQMPTLRHMMTVMVQILMV